MQYSCERNHIATPNIAHRVVDHFHNIAPIDLVEYTGIDFELTGGRL
jgi:hypothetical protein